MGVESVSFRSRVRVYSPGLLIIRLWIGAGSWGWIVPDHSDRMRQLRRDFSTIDHRVLMERGLHRSQVLSRHRRRALDKRTKQLLKKRVYPRLRDLIESGAGFPIDQTIRAFALEFNDRALSHGSEVMPASFNVMEAFLFPERVEDRIAVLRLHPERDHMFSLSDFLDFLTSKDGPIDPVKEALRAPEGIIHSYTPSGALEDLTFLYGDSRAFMVAGFSFVRHGSEITWVLLGGSSIRHRAYKHLRVGAWNPGPTKEIPPGEMA